MAQMLSWILLSLACVSHVLAQRFTIRHNNGQTECEVIAAGNKIDDTTTILKAFRECNNGGKVIFPEGQNYWIATRLNPQLNNIKIEWRGQWTVRSLLL